MLKRLAATLLAAPLALGIGGTANADTTVTLLPGCWGVLVVYCEVGVSVPVDLTSISVPVCTGTCTTVKAPYAYYNGGQVCAVYETRYGTAREVCA
jgi:hypothetical protein